MLAGGCFLAGCCCLRSRPSLALHRSGWPPRRMALTGFHWASMIRPYARPDGRVGMRRVMHKGLGKTCMMHVSDGCFTPRVLECTLSLGNFHTPTPDDAARLHYQDCSWPIHKSTAPSPFLPASLSTMSMLCASKPFAPTIFRPLCIDDLLIPMQYLARRLPCLSRQ